MNKSIIGISLFVAFCLVFVVARAPACEECSTDVESTETVVSTVSGYSLVKTEAGFDGTILAPARLCSSCGFGNKIDNCVVCGRWVANQGVAAKLCSSCAFGDKGTNCVKCGRWVGTSQFTGKLCNQCGFGDKKNNCIKCGRIVR